MKKLFLSVFFFATAMASMANPALPGWRTVTQSDGTQLELQLVGDEFLHYFITRDGKAVVERDGTYYYAQASVQGVCETDIVAHEASLRSTEEVEKLNALGDFHTAVQPAMLKARTQASTPRKIGTPTSYKGKKKGIIIMMNFSDTKFTYTRDDIEEIVNTQGLQKEFVYSLYNKTMTTEGSVHDYFSDMSNGDFDLTFDVVGPYTAQYSMKYYGKDNKYMNDVNVREFITEAINAADADVNYADYDWDGDNVVDQVFVLYPGYSQADGASSDCIWPHESTLSSSYIYGPYLDGKYFHTYACSSELSGTSGTNLAGLGTIVHEFSHCLGLPDVYDTRINDGYSNTNYGMDIWSPMNSGSRNASGWIPAPYTGYERYFCGWRTFRELTQPCVVNSLKPITDGGETYQIVNPGNANEYYLLENRNGAYGWDRGLYLDNSFKAVNGLMIYHVTYDKARFVNNTVNSTDGYCCYELVHADNSDKTTYSGAGGYYLDGDEYAHDLYPYSSGLGTANNHNFFSDESTPADVLNYANTDGTKYLHTNVSKITRKGSNVSFKFFDGTDSWEDVANAIKDVTKVNTLSDGKVYNLNGQEVGTSLDNLNSGVYIQNGKKVVVK